MGGFSRFGGALCWRAEVKRIHMRSLVWGGFPVLMSFLVGYSCCEAGPGGDFPSVLGLERAPTTGTSYYYDDYYHYYHYYLALLHPRPPRYPRPLVPRLGTSK